MILWYLCFWTLCKNSPKKMCLPRMPIHWKLIRVTEFWNSCFVSINCVLLSRLSLSKDWWHIIYKLQSLFNLIHWCIDSLIRWFLHLMILSIITLSIHCLNFRQAHQLSIRFHWKILTPFLFISSIFCVTF